jgi:hypothetical protein
MIFNEDKEVWSAFTVRLQFTSGFLIILDLVNILDTDILPYVIFLIVPVMGRMSDSDNDIRLLATETFATLVKLVPLEVHTCITPANAGVGWNTQPTWNV